MRKPKPLTADQAWPYALRLLSQRSYSEAGLSKKLREREVPPQAIAQIMAKLVNMHLIDDMRFAQNFVRTEANYRHASPYVIRQKLKLKGIGNSIIETVVGNNEEIPDESERAKYHAQKYATKYAPLSPFEKKQKIMAALFRKGFSSRAIQDAVNEVIS